jgi:hypothetical protein
MIYALLTLVALLLFLVGRYRYLYIINKSVYEDIYSAYGSLIYIMYAYIQARQAEGCEDELFDSLCIATGYDELANEGACHCGTEECDDCEECGPQED